MGQIIQALKLFFYLFTCSNVFFFNNLQQIILVNQLRTETLRKEVRIRNREDILDENDVHEQNEGDSVNEYTGDLYRVDSQIVARPFQASILGKYAYVCSCIECRSLLIVLSIISKVNRSKDNGHKSKSDTSRHLITRYHVF